MAEGQKPQVRQFGFTPRGNGNLRRAFGIHAAVVGGKSVDGKSFHQPAAFLSADADAETGLVEGPGDIHRHRIRRIGPDIVVMTGLLRIIGPQIFFKGKRLHFVGVFPIGQTGKKTRRRERNVPGIFRCSEGVPLRVVHRGHLLLEAPGLAQILPGFHSKDPGLSRRDERHVRRAANSREAT